MKRFAVALLALCLSVPLHAQVYPFFPPPGMTYNAATGQIAAANVASCTVNAQTGATYTLVLADANNCVTMNNASPNTLTVPPNSSVAFPVGTRITVTALNAATTVTPGAGVTFQFPSGAVAAAQNGAFTLKKVATDTWEWVASPSPQLAGVSIINGTTLRASNSAGACGTTTIGFCATIYNGILGNGGLASNGSTPGTMVYADPSGDYVIEQRANLPLDKFFFDNTGFQWGGSNYYNSTDITNGTPGSAYYYTDATTANCAGYWSTQPWTITGTGCTIIDADPSAAGNKHLTMGSTLALAIDIYPNLFQRAIGETTHVEYEKISSGGSNAVIVYGDNTTGTSSTNIVGGSAANTQANGVPILTGYSATSASIGGGALSAGACASTATTVTGAASGMAVVATPTTYPGDGNYWVSYVSASNTVTTKICAAVAGTPTASTYNIRVLK